eukprot:scaffold27343_cov135-Isochrysis_galbana.AAC.1
MNLLPYYLRNILGLLEASLLARARGRLGWATGSVQVPVALHRAPQTLWWAQLCGAQGTAL